MVSHITSIVINPRVPKKMQHARKNTSSVLENAYSKKDPEYTIAPMARYGLRCMPKIGTASLRNPKISLSDQGRVCRMLMVVCILGSASSCSTRYTFRGVLTKDITNPTEKYACRVIFNNFFDWRMIIINNVT